MLAKTKKNIPIIGVGENLFIVKEKIVGGMRVYNAFSRFYQAEKADKNIPTATLSSCLRMGMPATAFVVI